MSREATFLYNNLLLVAFCLTILWGVMYPLLTRGGARRDAVGVEAVLQLLPAQLRPAAAPADGHRPARRLAARVAARARPDVPHPARRRARHRRRADRGRVRLVDAGPARLHVLGVRRGVDRARVLARNARAPARSCGSSAATGAATAATSCTPRSCCFAIGVAGSSAYQTVGERGLHPGQALTRRRLHAALRRARDDARSRTPSRRARRRRLARRLARHDAAPGQEHLPGGEGDVERGRRSTTTRGISATCS